MSEELSHYHSLLRTVEPALLLTQSGAVALANGRALAIIGRTAPELPLHHHECPIFAPRHDPCLLCAALASVSGSSAIPLVTCRRVNEDGTVSAYSAVSLPLCEDGQAVGLLLLLRRDDPIGPVSGPRYADAHTPTGAQNSNQRDIEMAYPRITDRELQVADCLARGMTDRATAAALQITVNTARNHVQNLIHKLDVHTRTEAVARLLQDGLLDK